MTTTTKITKKDRYNAIIAVLTGVDGADELITFCEHEIELLEKKAAKAKATASTKKSDADPIVDAIKAVLTDEFTSIPDITKAINDEDITTSKVTYRVNALVEAGYAEKTQITIPGGEGVKSRKVQAYRVASVD